MEQLSSCITDRMIALDIINRDDKDCYCYCRFPILVRKKRQSFLCRFYNRKNNMKVLVS